VATVHASAQEMGRAKRTAQDGSAASEVQCVQLRWYRRGEIGAIMADREAPNMPPAAFLRCQRGKGKPADTEAPVSTLEKP